jgi:hypothetical protein
MIKLLLIAIAGFVVTITFIGVVFNHIMRQGK